MSDANVLLIPPAGSGSSVPIFTEGSIPFADSAGVLTEDNSNLFYDDTANSLMVGLSASPNASLHVKGQSDTVGNAMYLSNLSNLTSFRVRNLGSTVQDAYVTANLNTNQNDATILALTSTIANSPRFNFFANGHLEFSGAGKIGTIQVGANNSFFVTNALSSGGILLGYNSAGNFGADPSQHVVTVGTSSTYSGTGNTNIWSMNILGTFNQTGGASGTSAGVRIAPTLTSITTSYSGFDFDPTVTTVAALYGLRIRPAVSRSAFSMTAVPTAKVHIGAGTATASTAPLKIEAGTLLGTTEAGAIENDGTHLYVTFAAAGTRYQLDQQTAGSGADTALSNLAAVAINTSLISDTDNTDALGSAAIGWSDLFLGTGALINFANGDAVITHSAGILTVSTGDLRVTTAGTNAASVVTVGGTQTLTNKTLTSPVINTGTVGTSLNPTTDDGATLGDTTHNYSDLFLASGAVINYANSNVVITHTSGILTMGTGDLRVTTAGTNTASVVTVGGTQTLTNKTLTSPAIDTGTIGTSLVPTSDDGAALGSTANKFSDLFLASGAVINFNSGNVTLTHSAGLLTSNASLSIGTSNVFTAGTIELGHASANTLSATGGILSIESVAIPTISSTHTLTNKRITKRVSTEASSATPTINVDNVDAHRVTAQTVDITSFTTNLSGTPTDSQELLISVTGTAARAITFGASFAAGAVALPTTTTTTQRLDMMFKWSTVASKWMCMASGSYAD